MRGLLKMCELIA